MPHGKAKRRQYVVRGVAEVDRPSRSSGEDDKLSVEVDTESEEYTVISIKATNRPGILQAMTTTLTDLGLNVEKAVVDMEDDLVFDKFYVSDSNGEKVQDPDDVANIQSCLVTMLNNHFLKASGLSGRPMAAQAGIDSPGGELTERRQKDLLYSLMDSYTKNDVLSVQASIVNHVEYTIARSRYRFDDFEAYQVREPQCCGTPD